jgi:hypothetical protein
MTITRSPSLTPRSKKERNYARAIQWAQQPSPTGRRRSLKRAAEKFDIPARTLQDRAKHPERRPHATAHEAQMDLTLAEEAALKDFLLAMADRSFPLTPWRVREAANAILRKRDPAHRDVGENWPTAFRHRHKEIDVRWCRRLEKSRADSRDEKEWQRYYDLVRMLCMPAVICCSCRAISLRSGSLRMASARTVSTTWTRKGACWDNARAVEFSSAEAQRRRFQFKVPFSYHHHLRAYHDACTTDGNREMVTIIECCSADGSHIKPCYILKGKSVQDSWTTGDSLKAHFACSDSGWNDNVLSREWIEKVFDPETSANCPHGHKRRLLVLDGFASHVSYDFVQYAKSRDIDLLCLPAHSSADLQPLDVAVFGPVATRWSQEVETYSRAYESISKYDFAA